MNYKLREELEQYLRERDAYACFRDMFKVVDTIEEQLTLRYRWKGEQYGNKKSKRKNNY